MPLKPLKQNQIPELPNLSDFNFENIFSIYRKNGKYFYNLLNTINFPSNIRTDLYKDYIVRSGEIWPTISFKLYGSVTIWWTICVLNQIENPLVMPRPGTKIKVFTVAAINQVLQAMNS